MSSFLAVTAVCAQKDLVRRLRDPLAFVAWIGIPLLIGGLVSLMGGGSGGKPHGTLLVADLDDSFLSGALRSAFGGGPLGEMFDVRTVDEAEGRAELAAGQASALVVIPDGFGQALVDDAPCALELVKNPSQRILPGIVEELLSMLCDAAFYMQRIAAEPLRAELRRFAAGPPAGAKVFPRQVIADFSVAVNATVERLGRYLMPPVIELEVVEPAAEPAEASGAPPVGLATLFFPCLLFMSLFFIAGAFAEDVWLERAQGTLRRAVAGPYSVGPLLAGKLAAAGVLLAPIAALALGLGALTLGFRWRDLAPALVWFVACGVALVALLSLVQLFTTSQRAGSLVSNVIIFPLLMLGGAFFPFEIMPDWMAGIGRLTPNGWALERFKDVLFARAPAGELALGLAGIAAFTVCLYVAGRARLGGAFARGH